MTTKQATHAATTAATIKAYADKITADIQQGKAMIEQLEAHAKAKRAESEIAAINKLKAANQTIEQKVQDLKNAHESSVPGAKADIDAHIASLKSAIEDIGTKLKAQVAKK
jgi:hypothetical protein